VSLRQQINAVRDLPADERGDAARALVPAVELTAPDAATWVALARVLDPRAPVSSDPDEARAIALAALGVEGPLDVVRVARTEDDRAQAAAVVTRDRLRAAAAAALAAGQPATLVARECGVSRQQVYDWRG